MSYEVQSITVERCGVGWGDSVVTTYVKGSFGIDLIERNDDGSATIHFGTTNHTHTFPREEIVHYHD
jgi:hypothetical protein